MKSKAFRFLDRPNTRTAGVESRLRQVRVCMSAFYEVVLKDEKKRRRKERMWRNGNNGKHEKGEKEEGGGGRKENEKMESIFK